MKTPKTKRLNTGVVVTFNNNKLEVESPYYTDYYKKPYSRVTMMLNYLFKTLHNA